MDKKDYIKYALAILVAEKNLKNLKDIKWNLLEIKMLYKSLIGWGFGAAVLEI